MNLASNDYLTAMDASYWGYGFGTPTIQAAASSAADTTWSTLVDYPDLQPDAIPNHESQVPPSDILDMNRLSGSFSPLGNPIVTIDRCFPETEISSAQHSNGGNTINSRVSESAIVPIQSGLIRNGNCDPSTPTHTEQVFLSTLSKRVAPAASLMSSAAITPYRHSRSSSFCSPLVSDSPDRSVSPSSVFSNLVAGSRASGSEPMSRSSNGNGMSNATTPSPSASPLTSTAVMTMAMTQPRTPGITIKPTQSISSSSPSQASPVAKRIQNSDDDDEEKPRRKKARVANSHRKEICLYSEQHGSSVTQEEIARIYGVERSTISKIVKEKDRWLNTAGDEKALAIVRHRPSKFPQIEERMVPWLQSMSKLTRAISDNSIRDKAKEIAAELGIDRKNFKASSGWVDNFKRRHQIKKGSYSNSSGHPPLGTMEGDAEEESAEAETRGTQARTFHRFTTATYDVEFSGHSRQSSSASIAGPSRVEMPAAASFSTHGRDVSSMADAGYSLMGELVYQYNTHGGSTPSLESQSGVSDEIATSGGETMRSTLAKSAMETKDALKKVMEWVASQPGLANREEIGVLQNLNRKMNEHEQQQGGGGGEEEGYAGMVDRSRHAHECNML